MAEGLDLAGAPLANDRFRPLALLGRGSMGVVYRVHDTETDAEVALKTLHRRAPEEELMLKQEFRSLADIAHINLVELYELFVDERACFFTMEFIEGTDAVFAARGGRSAGAALDADATEAADRAARALAFDRAGDLYRRVLELTDAADGEAVARLTAKLAEQLGNAGRGLQAAEAFEAAARGWEGLGAGSDVLLGLKSKAAEQYLRVGRLEQGVAALRPVLRGLGVDLPASRAGTVALALRQRWQAWRRGRGFELRPTDSVAPQVLQRLEVCWGSSMVIAAMDPVLADVLCTRHMMDALDSGVSTHSARALTHDAVTCAQFGSKMVRRRVEALLAEARALNERTHDPFDEAVYETALGGVFYQQTEWRKSHTHSERAVAAMRERFPWLSFERATFECWSLTALMQMGQLHRVAERLPACIADADERDDLYSAIGFRTGMLNLFWLARDDAAEAAAQIDLAMSRWPRENLLHARPRRARRRCE